MRTTKPGCASIMRRSFVISSRRDSSNGGMRMRHRQAVRPKSWPSSAGQRHSRVAGGRGRADPGARARAFSGVAYAVRSLLRRPAGPDPENDLELQPGLRHLEGAYRRQANRGRPAGGCEAFWYPSGESRLAGLGMPFDSSDAFTHKSISKTTFFWTILGRPAIKGHEAGRAQL